MNEYNNKNQLSKKNWNNSLNTNFHPQQSKEQKQQNNSDEIMQNKSSIKSNKNIKKKSLQKIRSEAIGTNNNDQLDQYRISHQKNKIKQQYSNKNKGSSLNVKAKDSEVITPSTFFMMRTIYKAHPKVNNQMKEKQDHQVKKSYYADESYLEGQKSKTQQPQYLKNIYPVKGNERWKEILNPDIENKGHKGEVRIQRIREEHENQIIKLRQKEENMGQVLSPSLGLEKQLEKFRNVLRKPKRIAESSQERQFKRNHKFKQQSLFNENSIIGIQVQNDKNSQKVIHKNVYNYRIDKKLRRLSQLCQRIKSQNQQFANRVECKDSPKKQVINIKQQNNKQRQIDINLVNIIEDKKINKNNNDMRQNIQIEGQKVVAEQIQIEDNDKGNKQQKVKQMKQIGVGTIEEEKSNNQSQKEQVDNKDCIKDKDKLSDTSMEEDKIINDKVQSNIELKNMVKQLQHIEQNQQKDNSRQIEQRQQIQQKNIDNQQNKSLQNNILQQNNTIENNRQNIQSIKNKLQEEEQILQNKQFDDKLINQHNNQLQQEYIEQEINPQSEEQKCRKQDQQ